MRTGSAVALRHRSRDLQGSRLSGGGWEPQVVARRTLAIGVGLWVQGQQQLPPVAFSASPYPMAQGPRLHRALA